MPSTPTAMACSTAGVPCAWAVTGSRSRGGCVAGEGAFRVSAVDNAKVTVAEVTDRGHAGHELIVECCGDDVVDLLVRVPGQTPRRR